MKSVSKKLINLAFGGSEPAVGFLSGISEIILGTLTQPSRRPEPPRRLSGEGAERIVQLQGGRSRRCEHRRWRPTPQMDVAASRSQQGFVRVP